MAALSCLSLRKEFAEDVQRRSATLRRPFIGVHFRNTDHSSVLSDVIKRTLDVARQTSLEEVYWCTDDAESMKEAQAAMPDLTVSYFQPFNASGQKNLHRGLRGDDSVTHLKLVLADLFTLATATAFVSSEGSWKKLVPILRTETTLTDRFFGLAEEDYL